MQICGIVSEYNPFHNGHLWHIAETRRRLGEDAAIVCCMSGNWVQRGEAAILPKHIRASAALECGADLIIELPAAHALRSAEGFAQSAVGILASLGALTHLSFGAETGDIALLTEIAEILLEHRTVQETLVHLKSGISYAAARERALYARIKEKSEVISSPNNILAVEYIKALNLLGSSIVPIAVARKGAGHDSHAARGGTASASHIRALLAQGMAAQAAGFMPASVRDEMCAAQGKGLLLTCRSRLEAMVLAQLTRQTPETLAGLPDVSEGLEHRIYAAIRKQTSLAEIISAAKTRRYPEARIRRVLACAFLAITAQEAAQGPKYARVLGASDRGRKVLAAARKAAALPIIIKPAHAKRLDSTALEAFENEALRADLYHLTLPGWSEIPRGSDWITGAEVQNCEIPR